MSFLAPWALAAGALAALAIAALHLLSRQRPPEAPFPTARFVPEGTARATRMVPRPTDLPLLALRVVALLLLAAGFAGPVPTRGGARIGRIVMVEDAVPAARDSARHWLREGDVVVPFGDSARAMPAAGWRATGAPPAGPLHPPAPWLSPALAAAIGGAAPLAARVDSIELLLVAATTPRTDAASAALRAQWSGAVRAVHVAARPRAVPAMTVEVRWPTAGDSGAANPASIVAWGRGRSAYLPLRRVPLPAGTVLARWDDGAPAVVEERVGEGCVRHVGFVRPPSGDLLLRPSARRLLEAMAAPCAGAGPAPLDDAGRAEARAVLASFAQGPARIAAATMLGDERRSPYTLPLLVAGALLLLAESVVRRLSFRGSKATEESSPWSLSFRGSSATEEPSSQAVQASVATTTAEKVPQSLRSLGMTKEVLRSLGVRRKPSE